MRSPAPAPSTNPPTGEFPTIPPDCRLPVALARTLYSRILDKIEANGYDVFRRRARTSGLEKAAALVRQRLRSA